MALDVVNFKTVYFFVSLLKGENALVVKARCAVDESITEKVGCCSCFGRGCTLEYILFACFDFCCSNRIFADAYRPVVSSCVDGTH